MRYLPFCLKYDVLIDKTTNIGIFPSQLKVPDGDIDINRYKEGVTEQIKSGKFYMKNSQAFKGHDTRGWMFREVLMGDKVFDTVEEAWEEAGRMAENFPIDKKRYMKGVRKYAKVEEEK